MRAHRFLFALVVAASPLAAQVAPHVATTLPPAELSALETIRKAVWVDWFSGDTAAMHRVLAPELVAISPDGNHWQGLAETMAGSAQFKAGGGKLVSVNFTSNLTHRFGDVVVMFSHYTVVTSNAGKQQTQKGRATEVFVKHQGKWVLTSWHLDVTGGE